VGQSGPPNPTIGENAGTTANNQDIEAKGIVEKTI
jgi:hypothetical protein